MIRIFIKVCMILYVFHGVSHVNAAEARVELREYLSRINNSAVMTCADRLLGVEGDSVSSLSDERITWKTFAEWASNCNLFVFATSPYEATKVLMLEDQELSVSVFSCGGYVNELTQNNSAQDLYLSAILDLHGLFDEAGAMCTPSSILDGQKDEILQILQSIHQAERMFKRKQIHVKRQKISITSEQARRLVSLWGLLKRITPHERQELLLWNDLCSLALCYIGAEELFEYGSGNRIFGGSLSWDYYESDDIPFLLILLYQELQVYVMCQQNIIWSCAEYTMNLLEKRCDLMLQYE